MFWLNSCPRCGGDLISERDTYGSFISCMQCGLSKDVKGAKVDPSQINMEPVPAPTVPQSESGVRRRLSHGGRHSYSST